MGKLRLIKFADPKPPKAPPHIEFLANAVVIVLALGLLIGLVYLVYLVFTYPLETFCILFGIAVAVLFVWLVIIALKSIFGCLCSR